ncbi:hypothetical protein [Aquisphaera insulae]|uniref:hypothetical protein n=1 Tax=Aquisphaera insulae TaxID=2712864 RepID=UPI0013EDD60C|nr:hypothetical protein [Aquisphaera insulae]
MIGRRSRLLAALGVLLSAPMDCRSADPAGPSGVRYLEDATRRLLEGCRITAGDGTTLYTPDGKAHYRALWTRDFAYMVENAGDLIPARDVEACLRYLIRAQRDDGTVPDRVQPDGVAVYAAGAPDHPVGLANLDNPAFLVIAVDEHLRRLPESAARSLFDEWSPQLDRAMAWVPRNPGGLVYNDPARPHSPYGFTDTVGKTGELFMESLLDWTASRRLATRHQHAGRADRAEAYRRACRAIEEHLHVLWDDHEGAFLAATRDCRQVDIWGNAFAIHIGIPLADRRGRVLHYLANNQGRFVWRGQVRHLPRGEHWQRLLAPVEPERYQNGAYWATASGWMIEAIASVDPPKARSMFEELLADFRSGGICECINVGYRQLDSYVANATNPLAAARRLGW